jgi:hypothetical protein
VTTVWVLILMLKLFLLLLLLMLLLVVVFRSPPCRVGLRWRTSLRLRPLLCDPKASLS